MNSTSADMGLMLVWDPLGFRRWLCTKKQFVSHQIRWEMCTWACLSFGHVKLGGRNMYVTFRGGNVCCFSTASLITCVSVLRRVDYLRNTFHSDYTGSSKYCLLTVTSFLAYPSPFLHCVNQMWYLTLVLVRSQKPVLSVSTLELISCRFRPDQLMNQWPPSTNAATPSVDTDGETDSVAL